MAFSPQFLEELRTRSVLSDSVGRRVRLVKKGREFHGLCPFHKEKTPSFTVNDEKGFYHCFGCGEHGSVYDFVMKTEGLNFPETVERLAVDAGMEVPQDSPEERQRTERRRSLEDVTEAACTWFERALRMPEGKQALDYLHGRGLDDKTIAAFRLGFAPNGRNGLKNALMHDGIEEDMLVETGMLIRPPEERDDRTPYDRFRGRVMFPIMDRRGHVIAFGGRIMGEGEPKYLNSPETPIFHKGQVLYGLGQALPGARKSGRMYVTEGYMDVIALHMAGFDEAVAPLGTALTEDHLRALWRVVREPVLCFDGDKAGQRAAARAAERALPLLKSGYGLRFAGLPAGEDPDTLVRSQGREAMQDIFNTTLPLSEMIWRMETGGTVPTTPEDRAAAQQKLGEHARRIEDPTVRSHFASFFNERIWQGQVPPQIDERDNNRDSGRDSQQGTGYDSGRDSGWSNNRNTKQNTGRSGARGGFGGRGKQGSKYGGSGYDTPQIVSGDAARAKSRKPEPRQLEILLATLISHPTLFDAVGERLGALDFTVAGQKLDNLRQEVLKTLATDSSLEFDGLSDHLRNTGFAGALDGLMGSRVIEDVYFARPGIEPNKALIGWEETFTRMQGKNLDSEIRDALQRYSEDQSEENSQRLLLLQKQKLEASSVHIGDA